MFSIRSYYIGLAIFSVIIFTFQHDLIGRTTRWAAPTIERVSAQIQSVTAQKERLSKKITGFSHVAAHELSDSKLEDVIVWKTIFQSDPTDDNEAVLSLVKTGECESPYIWNITRNEFTQVEAPTIQPPLSEGNWCVTHLGAFHGGRAPAGFVKYQSAEDSRENNSKQYKLALTSSQTLWGYVDVHGKWVIQPHYKEASSYVGGIAVVTLENGEIRLIDRNGHDLPWPPAQQQKYTPLSSIRIHLKRFGKWVWINHLPNHTEPTYLSDGEQMIPLPGSNATPSADGELWLLQTPDGPRLWKQATGFITLPDNLIPVEPITSNLFTSYSNTGRSLALFSIDGTMIADPSMIQQALTPTRFIACITGTPETLYDMKRSHQHQEPGIPSNLCGIMDEKGQWWATPVYQMIERWGEHEVRLQSGSSACMADLRGSPPLDCAKNIASSNLVPLFDIDGSSRLYGYQNSQSASPPLFRYALAYPYIGRVAIVAEENGLAGLIDEKQQWLTPHLSAPPVAEARILSPVYEKVGTGLIDRSGKWVIPPVFNTIERYSDGTLKACISDILRPVLHCKHLDTSGNLLPQTTERTLDSLGWKEQSDVTLSVDKPEQDSPPAMPRYRAVALNGIWGYQDISGKWVIEPRFDDAEDFFGEYGAAGVLHENTQEPDSEAPVQQEMYGKRMRWGIIERSGEWRVEPSFDSIGVFKDGFAVAKQDEYYGLIDEEGNWIVEPQYRSIGTAKNGFAPAVKNSGEHCLIDMSNLRECFSGVDMIIETRDRFIVARDDRQRYGYVTSKGEWVISPTFTSAYPFVRELAAASASIPDLPDDERKRWILLATQPLHIARLFAVTAQHPGELNSASSRIGLMDDSGRWLVPKRSWLSSLLSPRSNNNDHNQ